jgi:hypothetical protein
MVRAEILAQHPSSPIKLVRWESLPSEQILMTDVLWRSIVADVGMLASQPVRFRARREALWFDHFELDITEN